ncbi:hypothetical protein [Methylobacterium sp. Leaf100]|uniref:hypothetical protein n=1 Tax=Methylobacterium sp. Leaf100 TaxID=1736252 RepID=UPI000701C1C6|nr:hypothetical protein [Methylobacterium sp. Leaf100]KQP27068.1 hypothetical protein ASF25_21065 [Methylobacterium sp. Leaf100]
MMADDKKVPKVESTRTTIRSSEVQVPEPTFDSTHTTIRSSELQVPEPDLDSKHTTEDVVDTAQKKGDTPDKAAKYGFA